MQNLVLVNLKCVTCTANISVPLKWFFQEKQITPAVHLKTIILSIVGFFIPVSSLKIFGHSIHSERRRIYLGKSIQPLQNDTIIMSIQFQGHPANSEVAYL